MSTTVNHSTRASRQNRGGPPPAFRGLGGSRFVYDEVAPHISSPPPAAPANHSAAAATATALAGLGLAALGQLGPRGPAMFSPSFRLLEAIGRNMSPPRASAAAAPSQPRFATQSPLTLETGAPAIDIFGPTGQMKMARAPTPASVVSSAGSSSRSPSPYDFAPEILNSVSRGVVSRSTSDALAGPTEREVHISVTPATPSPPRARQTRATEAAAFNVELLAPPAALPTQRTHHLSLPTTMRILETLGGLEIPGGLHFPMPPTTTPALPLRSTHRTANSATQEAWWSAPAPTPPPPSHSPLVFPPLPPLPPHVGGNVAEADPGGWSPLMINKRPQTTRKATPRPPMNPLDSPPLTPTPPQVEAEREDIAAGGSAPPTIRSIKPRSRLYPRRPNTPPEERAALAAASYANAVKEAIEAAEAAAGPSHRYPPGLGLGHPTRPTGLVPPVRPVRRRLPTRPPSSPSHPWGMAGELRSPVFWAERNGAEKHKIIATVAEDLARSGHRPRSRLSSIYYRSGEVAETSASGAAANPIRRASMGYRPAVSQQLDVKGFFGAEVLPTDESTAREARHQALLRSHQAEEDEVARRRASKGKDETPANSSGLRSLSLANAARSSSSSRRTFASAQIRASSTQIPASSTGGLRRLSLLSGPEGPVTAAMRAARQQPRASACVDPAVIANYSVARERALSLVVPSLVDVRGVTTTALHRLAQEVATGAAAAATLATSDENRARTRLEALEHLDNFGALPQPTAPALEEHLEVPAPTIDEHDEPTAPTVEEDIVRQTSPPLRPATPPAPTPEASQPEVVTPPPAPQRVPRLRRVRALIGPKNNATVISPAPACPASPPAPTPEASQPEVETLTPAPQRAPQLRRVRAFIGPMNGATATSPTDVPAPAPVAPASGRRMPSAFARFGPSTRPQTAGSRNVSATSHSTTASIRSAMSKASSRVVSWVRPGRK